MSTESSFPPRYTVDDYRHWKGDWELWKGYPVAMVPSPFGPHAAVVSRLSRRLGNQIEDNHCDAITLVELDWIVSGDTVVRPDLVVVCGDPPERHLETPPTLVAEVLSPSTAGSDRTFKQRLYQDHGVATYLMIDPRDRTVVAQRLSTDGGYEEETVGEVLWVTLCGNCRIEFETRLLFG